MLKFNINNFGMKRSGIISRLTELEIYALYYAVQAKIKLLEWESILNTSRQNIKKPIQRRVAQLSMTNRYRVAEVFLEPALLFLDKINI